MIQPDYELLKRLCEIHAPSGNESAMTDFVLEYVKANHKKWKSKPKVLKGGKFGDALILVFGKPGLAVFAHMDSVGFTVGYNNALIPIGSPVQSNGVSLRTDELQGGFKGSLLVNKKTRALRVKCKELILRGTDLTFEPNFLISEDFVQSCSLDNRVGVWIALQLAATMQNGALVFSCYEEHGGGMTSFLGGYLFEHFDINRALIADVTWVTSGIHAGEGVVLSLRDMGIPRKKFVLEISRILKKSRIIFQQEVEAYGGSDGTELQRSPFPYEWCFIGPPETGVHSHEERIAKKDLVSTLEAYELLVNSL